MPLVYRAVLDDVDDDIVRDVERVFVSWLHSKSLVPDDFRFPPAMSAALTSSDQPAWIQRRSTALGPHAGHLHRIRLIEEGSDSRWITTALWRTAAPEQQALDMDVAHQQLSVLDAAPARSWVWVDLEHEPFGGRPVRPASPRVVRDLMAAGEAHDGPLPLTAEALTITKRHVGELVGYLKDPDRRVPIAVFAHDPLRAYDQERLAQQLARDLAGVAAVFRLADEAATSAFGVAVPPEYHVYGGALRTYLPQAMAPGDVATRHRVLGRTSIATLRQRAFPAVKDQILHLSTQRSGPLDGATLRRLLAEPAARASGVEPGSRRPADATLGWFARQVTRIRRALGEDADAAGEYTAVTVAQRELTAAIDRLLRRPAADVEAAGAADDELEVLRAQLAESEAERVLLNSLFEEAAADAETAQRSGQERADEAEFLQLELAETTREWEAGRRRIRWLEARVRELNASAWAEQDDAVQVPASVAEVLLLARSRLTHIAIGPTDEDAAELDVHPAAELFAAKTWDALTALDDYAAAVRAGRYSGNFHLWCQQPASAKAVSATAVALAESESVDAHPQLRGKRTFPVPPQVATDGQQYMPAHVKIVKRGAPAPRLHFHDDTRGATGVVHVGYVGAHLPTASFK